MIEKLIQQHVSIQIDGDELVVRGPAIVLTPNVLAALREHKPEIIAYLWSDDGPSHVLRDGDCPALHDGGACCCEPILVKRRDAREWGWSV